MCVHAHWDCGSICYTHRQSGYINTCSSYQRRVCSLPLTQPVVSLYQYLFFTLGFLFLCASFGCWIHTLDHSLTIFGVLFLFVFFKALTFFPPQAYPVFSYLEVTHFLKESWFLSLLLGHACFSILSVARIWYVCVYMAISISVYVCIKPSTLCWCL